MILSGWVGTSKVAMGEPTGTSSDSYVTL